MTAKRIVLALLVIMAMVGAAGATILSNNSEASTASSSYVSLLTLTMTEDYTGDATFQFQCKNTVSANPYYCRLYKTTAFGTEHIEDFTSYHTYSQTFVGTSWNVGDVFELKGAQPGSGLTYVTTFNVTYGSIEEPQILDNDSSLFWVRTDGNDTACNGQNNMSYIDNSTDCAWSTIQNAASILSSGQTVNIVNLSTLYTSSEDFTFTNSGSNDTTGRIKYIGVGLPEFYTNCANCRLAKIYSKNNLTFDGIYFNGTSSGSYVFDLRNTKNIQIKNNTIHLTNSSLTMTEGDAILLYSDGDYNNDTLIEGNIIYSHTGGIEGTTANDGDNYRITIYNNTIAAGTNDQDSGSGIIFKTCEYCNWTYNTITYGGYIGIKAIGNYINTSYNDVSGKFSHNMIDYGRSDALVDGDLTHDYTFIGNNLHDQVIGFAGQTAKENLYCANTAYNITIQDNVFNNTSAAAIKFSACFNVLIENNTVTNHSGNAIVVLRDYQTPVTYQYKISSANYSIIDNYFQTIGTGTGNNTIDFTGIAGVNISNSGEVGEATDDNLSNLTKTNFLLENNTLIQASTEANLIFFQAQYRPCYTDVYGLNNTGSGSDGNITISYDNGRLDSNACQFYNGSRINLTSIHTDWLINKTSSYTINQITNIQQSGYQNTTTIVLSEAEPETDYIPADISSCSTNSKSSSNINITCSNPGGLNLTDSMNFTDGTTWNNGSLSADFTGLSSDTIYNYQVWAYNNSGNGSLSVAPFAYQETTDAISGSSNITSYYNSINGWNQTAMTINAGNSATFNVTVNQTVTNISWKVDGAEEQNTSSLEFTRSFNTLGDFNVTAQAFNANGSSNIIYTVVTVNSVSSTGTSGSSGTSERSGVTIIYPKISNVTSSIPTTSSLVTLNIIQTDTGANISLRNNENKTNTYNINYELKDIFGKVIKTDRISYTLTSGETKTSTLNIKNTVDGIYTLKVVVSNSSTGINLVSSTKVLYISKYIKSSNILPATLILISTIGVGYIIKLSRRRRRL